MFHYNRSRHRLAVVTITACLLLLLLLMLSLSSLFPPDSYSDAQGDGAAYYSASHSLAAADFFRSPSRPMDMDSDDEPPNPHSRVHEHKKRRIAIKFLYLGWDYDGFVVQETMKNTIEDHLFRALKLTRMIESRDSSGYHRCGRTDIGVSAFCQVISIDVKSMEDHADQEINYPFLLNRALPDEIRCIAWSPIGSQFSARFDCRQRSYKYFFPRGSLDVVAITKAAAYLVGEHDFRNFCKLDANNQDKTIRTILTVDVCSFGDHSSNVTTGTNIRTSPYDMFCLTISAHGFLWHQIRCILSILFLVGEGKEEPTIVRDLLNVSKHPFKPQFQLASGLPLVLYDCLYDDDELDWVIDYKTLSEVICALQTLWTKLTIKATMIKSMINDVCLLHPALPSLKHQHECLSNEKSKKRHKKICDRPVSTKYPASGFPESCLNNGSEGE